MRDAPHIWVPRAELVRPAPILASSMTYACIPWMPHFGRTIGRMPQSIHELRQVTNGVNARPDRFTAPTIATIFMRYQVIPRLSADCQRAA